MQTAFWHERWQNNQIGFHQDTINEWLTQYWSALLLPRGSTVFVPLCGKSRDMLWLCDQGYQVIGVELSDIAIRDFFTENPHLPVEQTIRYGLPCWESTGLQLYCADFFHLPAEALREVSCFYDRAALIALPPAMRKNYVTRLSELLSTDSKGLLITMSYPQEKISGPPFSVTEETVQNLYQALFRTQLLHKAVVACDIPRFQENGVPELTEYVYTIHT